MLSRLKQARYKFIELEIGSKKYSFYTSEKLDINDNIINNRSNKNIFLHSFEEIFFSEYDSILMPKNVLLILNNSISKKVIEGKVGNSGDFKVIIQMRPGSSLSLEHEIISQSVDAKEKFEWNKPTYITSKNGNQDLNNVISNKMSILEIDRLDIRNIEFIYTGQIIILDSTFLEKALVIELIKKFNATKQKFVFISQDDGYDTYLIHYKHLLLGYVTNLKLNEKFFELNHLFNWNSTTYTRDNVKRYTDVDVLENVLYSSPYRLFRFLSKFNKNLFSNLDVVVNVKCDSIIQEHRINNLIASNIDFINITIANENEKSVLPINSNFHTKVGRNEINLNINSINYSSEKLLSYWHFLITKNDEISYDWFSGEYSDYYQNEFTMDEMCKAMQQNFENVDVKFHHKNATIFYLIDKLPDEKNIYVNQFSVTQIKSLEQAGYDVIAVTPSPENDVYYCSGLPIYRLNRNEFRKIVNQISRPNIMIGFYSNNIKAYIDDLKANIIISTLGIEVQTLEDRFFLKDDKLLNITPSKLESIFENRLDGGLRNISGRSYKYTFPSNYLKLCYKENISSNIGEYEILPTPIDTLKYNFSNQRIIESCDKIKVLSISSYSSNVYANEVMVESIMYLSSYPEFNNFEFTIIGAGGQFAKITSILKMANFSNVTIINSFVEPDYIHSIHKEHDVYLNLKRMDSQGVSRLEAMASGLCVIENQLSVTKEFSKIENKKLISTIIVPLDAEKIAECMRKLNILEIKNIGRIASEYVVENYSFDNMVRQYESLFIGMGKQHLYNPAMKINRSRPLYESSYYNVMNHVFIDRGFDTTIVVFTPWTSEGNIELSEGKIKHNSEFISQNKKNEQYCYYYKTFEQLKANLLFITDSINTFAGWNSIDRNDIIVNDTITKIEKLLNQKRLSSGKIIFYGFSKGGYIAALYGQNIKCVSEIIITNPQLSLRYLDGKGEFFRHLLYKNDKTLFEITDNMMFSPRYLKNITWFGIKGNSFDDYHNNLIGQLNCYNMDAYFPNEKDTKHNEFVPKYIGEILKFLECKINNEDGKKSLISLRKDLGKEYTIIGSCVSRDMFRIMKYDNIVLNYYSRVTLNSVLSKPFNERPIFKNGASEYRMRNVCLNYDKNFIFSDNIVMDFIDYRFFDIKKDDSLLTKSIFVNEIVENIPDGENIDYLDEVNFPAVIEAIDKFIYKHASSNIYIIISKLAKIDVEGNAIKLSPRDEKLDIFLINLMKILEEYSNVVTVTPPDKYLVTTKEHEWGSAPFHYIDGYYKYCFDKITSN